LPTTLHIHLVVSGKWKRCEKLTFHSKPRNKNT